MYGFDPINLEKKDIDVWLHESPDNILLVIEKNTISFSKTKSYTSKSKSKKSDLDKNSSNEKIFCLKRQYLTIPN